MNSLLPKKTHRWSAFIPFLPYVQRYKRYVLAAVGALLASSTATVLLPIVVRFIIDVDESGELSFVSVSSMKDSYFLILLGIVALLSFASGARYYFVSLLGERIIADLRREVFDHLLHLDMEFFDRTKIGNILSHLTTDATQLKSAFGAATSIAIRDLFMLVASVGMMIYTAPKLALEVLIAIPMIVIPVIFVGRWVRKRTRSMQESLADVSASASDILQSIRLVKAFRAEEVTNAHFSDTVSQSYQRACATIRGRAFVTSTIIFLVFAGTISVIWSGLHDVWYGQMSAGLLSQFVLYALLSAGALSELSQVSGEIYMAAGAAERIQDLLAYQPRKISSPKSVLLSSSIRGNIEFREVHFSYPSKRHLSALTDLNFKIEAGEHVAIVGPSGAGKSTIFQLLMRFYDPQKGSICLDGYNIATLQLQELRNQLSFVPQQNVILGATIAENIRYGKPGASEAEIEKAACQAHADSFIQKLPKKYEATIGERGVLLSAGQRQRIAIARILLRDAPILLLDEATSALDSESENLIHQSLRTLMQNRTTVVIAHRFATIVSADRILVLEQGHVIEQGKHAELIQQNGLYARLARFQFTQEAGSVI